MIEYREKPVPVEVVKFRSPPIDEALLRPCNTVTNKVTTNGELLDAYIEANMRLIQCNADKTELRNVLKGAPNGDQ